LLKTVIDGKTWLVSQPDHAAVSGYLIAHWGNQEFAKPGYYAETPQPEDLRAETIFGIAEHDNGWWEWEADPEIDERDGLPLHLTDLSQQEGFGHWRRGVPRFQERHPYTALLIVYPECKPDEVEGDITVIAQARVHPCCFNCGDAMGESCSTYLGERGREKRSKLWTWRCHSDI
jgi:hypothetical protein